jgi:hypothetical protein
MCSFFFIQEYNTLLYADKLGFSNVKDSAIKIFIKISPTYMSIILCSYHNNALTKKQMDREEIDFFSMWNSFVYSIRNKKKTLFDSFDTTIMYQYNRTKNLHSFLSVYYD